MNLPNISINKSRYKEGEIYKLQWMCTKRGKLITCFLLTCLIYYGITFIYELSTKKVNAENQENQAKSLNFFIDR